MAKRDEFRRSGVREKHLSRGCLPECCGASPAKALIRKAMTHEVLPMNAAGDDFDVFESDVLVRDERETVYRGRQRAQEREVAIHVVRGPRASADPGLSRSFQEEVESLSRLEDRDLVRFRGGGIWQDRLFYATEPIRGESLTSSRAPGLRFTSEEIFHVAEGVARALRAIQPCRILHGDIRPACILLNGDGAVKVARLALRKTPDASEDQQASLSRWRYASPEEGTGKEGDIRSDIFALGAVLYELASGKPTFEGYDSPTSLRYQVVHSDPPPPREQGALILPELERLILRCLAKDPEHRYRDPDELLQELKVAKESIARADRPAGAEDHLGDFEIDEGQILAEGGMGTLYRGLQRTLRRPVAIKVLRERFAGDPEFVLRFRREAELLAQLNHPNVVQVFGTGTWRGRHFYAMELLEGKDAATHLKEQGRLEPREALHIVEEVAKALSAAWKYRIVHRDIKPSNILITPAGEVKVADFGLAKSLRIPKGESRLIAGTSEYVSPEQGLGNAVDIRSDLYSLGIVHGLVHASDSSARPREAPPAGAGRGSLARAGLGPGPALSRQTAAGPIPDAGGIAGGPFPGPERSWEFDERAGA